jgi:hypothetical protein
MFDMLVEWRSLNNSKQFTIWRTLYSSKSPAEFSIVSGGHSTEQVLKSQTPALASFFSSALHGLVPKE